MLKYKLSGVALLGAFSLVVIGCGSGDSGGTTGAAGATTGGEKGGKHYKFAFVTNNPSDYWTIARKGVEKADAELADVDVEFKMPDGSAENQKDVVTDLLVKGVDAMAISPLDAANQTDMLNDAAKKALLFTQDSDAPKSDRVCYIGTDNIAAGKQAGEEIKTALGPNGGKIVAFVGKMDAQNAKDRIEGLKEAIKGSKVELIDTRTDDADHSKARTNASDIIVKDPEIAGMVGIWSYNGPAILSAVKAAGKVGKIKIVCFDEEKDTLDGVKDGSIAATVVQQPFEFGYQAVIDMHKYLQGDKSGVPANKQKIIPTKVIHTADVDAFATKLKELRGK